MRQRDTVNELIQEHCNDLAQLRSIIRYGYQKLGVQPDDDQNKQGKFSTEFWGDKETFLSALTKLAQLHIKIIPLEQSLLHATAENCVQDEQRKAGELKPLSDDDWELLLRIAKERLKTQGADKCEA